MATEAKPKKQSKPETVTPNYVEVINRAQETVTVAKAKASETVNKAVFKILKDLADRGIIGELHVEETQAMSQIIETEVTNSINAAVDLIMNEFADIGTAIAEKSQEQKPSE